MTTIMNHPNETDNINAGELTENSRTVAVLEKGVETEVELPTTTAEAVAVSPAHAENGHKRGLWHVLADSVVAFYDLLSGPPMTERDRLRREIAESHHNIYNKHIAI